jgi:hypothetical protein
MKIWFDTEFYENGRTIDLISLGAVCEDGSEFYAEVKGYEITDPWLLKNVQPYLTGPKLPKDLIASNFLKFVMSKTDRPEFWAYYSDYDWVVLCQLYGRMIDLPKVFPMFCRDLKQELDRKGVTEIPITNPQEHNAIADAKWAKEVHEWLENS